MTTVKVMRLLKALEILAATKDNQIIYLIGLGTFPSTDELALQFDDAYQVFKGNIDKENYSNPFDKNILKILESIDLMLEDMSKGSDHQFWDISSLDEIQWSKVRKLAREALRLIGGSLGKPNPKYV